MGSDDVYALISDVLGLAGKYPRETFSAARAHVERAFQGHDQQALLRIIHALDALVQERARGNETQHRREHDDDFELHEVAAILLDPAFMPKKADLVALLTKAIAKPELKVSRKDSREAVVRKALLSFQALPPSSQQRAYKVLRTRFIKDRGSSLKDWSDIISE